MEQSRITNSAIVALIIGLIIGFAGGAYWYKGKLSSTDDKKTDTKTVVDNETTKTGTKIETKESAKLEIPKTTIVSTVLDTSIITTPNQKAGDRVVVTKVVSNTEIWATVREDVGGLIGNILGAKRVGAGTSQDVVIELLRPTVAGMKYYVVLFKDDGDGMFDHKVDTLIESDGSTLVSTFRAQ